MSYLGIRGFESILRGGIPARAEVLLLTPEGTERHLLGAHWVVEGLKRGERVLVILSEEAPDVFFARLGRMGVDAPAAIASGALVVIDWYAAWEQSAEGVTEVNRTIRVSRAADDLFAAVDRAVQVLLPAPERRAFVDILPRAVKELDAEALAALMQGVRSRLVAQAVTTIFIADRAAPERTLAALTKDFHAILDARGEGNEVLAFAVLRVGGARLTPRYRRVRLREDGAAVEAEPTTRTFSCPICDARVPFDAEKCPSCGTPRADMASRAEPTGLMTYLESLSEKEGVPVPRGRVTPRPKPEPRAPGLTNGVRAGRVNGGAAGRVNGTPAGRVNGTASGRVNGVAPKGRTNGLARAGMVNGTRGRTTGVTNGLTNGLVRARSGITNGLTNGSGFTNGLGSRRARAEVRRARWKLYLVPILAVALLLTPLLMSESSRPTFVVDGRNEEWTGVPGYTQPASGVSATVDLVEYRVAVSGSDVHLFAVVAGTWFADTGSVDALYAFLDTDRNAATGYRVLGLGADALSVVEGGEGTIFGASLRTWTGTAGDADNWTAWSPTGSVTAASAGAILELAFPWDTSWPGDAAHPDPTILLLADDGQASRSYSVPFRATAVGALRASISSEDTVTGAAAPFVLIDLVAFGGPVTVTDVTVAVTGGVTALPPTPALPVTVTPGGPQTLVVPVDAAGAPSGALANGTVTGIATLGDLPVLVDGGTVRAYVAAAPTGKRVDGWFGDWIQGDKIPDGHAARGVRDRDINNTAATRAGTDLLLYVDVKGDLLAGTPVPVRRLKPGSGGPPSASSPEIPARVAGEDRLDMYVDVDSGQSTGTPVLGLGGADFLLEVRGIHGRVLAKTLYEWQGGWRRVADANVATGARELEANVTVPAAGAVEVVFQTSAWDGPADTTEVTGTRGGVRSDGGGYAYDGRFTATFGADGRVAIAANEAQFAWTLPDVYGDGGAWTLEPTGVGVRYSRPEVEVAYAIDRGGMKEDIVLARPGVPAELLFPIEWGNRTQVWEDPGGTIGILGGQVREFDMGQPFAVDATGAVTPLSLVPDLPARALRIPLPPAVARGAFPVAIDPPVRFYLYDNGTTYKASESLGSSVAIGDFNGDGYADVLTGAPLWPGPSGWSGHSNIGYAYVYYGPINADKTNPDVRINGSIGTNDLRFGFAVAAGKLNGDAYWDALVSRVSNTALGVTGPVCILYGSSGWSGDVGTCDVTIQPPSGPANFGWVVAAGNVDNANYDDVLIGEPGRDNNGDTTADGLAYLYKSPFASNITTANHTLWPSTNNSWQFGKSVAMGKVDSDTYPDIVVGEPSTSAAGRIQFFKGIQFASGSGNRYANATVNAPSGGGSSSTFGSSLAVGKLNGDNYEDVVVGAPTRNTNNGQVFYYLANGDGSGLTSGAGASGNLPSQSSSERFGSSVAIMDWDNDGAADVFVGAITATGQGGSPSNAGRMYYFDDPLTDTTVDETIYGTASNERLGTSLAVGKFASDTYVQLAIGAPNWPKSGSQTDGRVVVATIPETPAALLSAALAVPPVVWRLRARRSRSRPA